MHIYTRHGDDGRTLLLRGPRVWKDDPRVQTCGEVDELCSWLGVVAAHLPDSRPELTVQIRQVQAELFAVGAAAQLAGRLDAQPEIRTVGAKECSRMERWIDALEAELPALDGFVIPGGSPAAAFIHVARSTCRRTERRMVALARNTDADGAATLSDAVAYLNRLADFLFMLGRFCNHIADVEETVVSAGAEVPPRRTEQTPKG